MDKTIRDVQLRLLNLFSKVSKTFALSGGIALELFYLKHGFSRDLDFFSPEYNLKEISNLVSFFDKYLGGAIKLENELVIADKARLRFYTTKIKGAKYPLKIDFIEDVFFNSPVIKRFNKIPVYDVMHIYHQKIMALIGTTLGIDITGREIVTGRKEVRDIVDIYYLSKKICPLHKFVKRLLDSHKRGLVYWYRIYSREDLKFGVLDLDIYDKGFDISELITYFDEEIRRIITETVGESR